jgi:polysaccharide biosynthesis/export protein
MGIAAFTVACAGAGARSTATMEEVLSRDYQKQQQTKELNDRLFASVSSPPNPQDYILSAGDLVFVSVFEAPDLKTEARVGARGHITLPLVGPVLVMGMTTAEAEKNIEELYRAKYLQDPHVNIFVKEQQGQKITVVGAVKKPGNFEYPARRRLLDVLAQSEGLTEKAGTLIQVRRAAGDPDHPEVLFIDMDELVKKGRTELNIEIKGGDVLFVPEGGTVFVDGAVRKPGAYTITKAMTIEQAIAFAGGFSVAASEDNIKVARVTADGKREIIQLAFDKAQQNTIGFQVQDADIVFVETNKLEAFIYGRQASFLGYGISYRPPAY